MKTTEEFNTAVNEAATAMQKLDELEAQLKAELAKVQERYAPLLEVLKGTVRNKTKAAERFAKKYPSKVFPSASKDAKRGETGMAFYKIRKTPDVLKTMKNWTWEKVLERIKTMPTLAGLLRLDPTLDKERIKNDMRKTNKREWQNIGVRLVDDQKFVIEPKPKMRKENAA